MSHLITPLFFFGQWFMSCCARGVGGDNKGVLRACVYSKRVWKGEGGLGGVQTHRLITQHRPGSRRHCSLAASIQAPNVELGIKVIQHRFRHYGGGGTESRAGMHGNRHVRAFLGIIASPGCTASQLEQFIEVQMKTQPH